MRAILIAFRSERAERLSQAFIFVMALVALAITVPA